MSTLTHAHYVRRLPLLCLKSGGAGLPRNPQDRDLILTSVLATLPRDREISHQDLDEALERWLETVGRELETDYVAIRRALVDFKFLVRPADGLTYRRAERLPVEVEAAVWDADPAALVRDAERERAARRAKYVGGGA